MKTIAQKRIALFFSLLAGLGLLPVSVSAQSLTLSGYSPGASLFSGVSQGAVLAVVRVILVAALLISGMVAYRAGYNWIYWEGNAKKAHENKLSLSSALLIITALFLILVVLNVFIGDYSTLVF